MKTYPTQIHTSSASTVKRGKHNSQRKNTKKDSLPAAFPQEEIDRSSATTTTQSQSPLASTFSHSSSAPDQGSSENSSPKAIQISFVNAAAFSLLAKNKDNQAFLLPNNMLDQLDSLNIADLSANPLKDDREYVDNLKYKVPSKYHE